MDIVTHMGIFFKSSRDGFRGGKGGTGGTEYPISNKEFPRWKKGDAGWGAPGLQFNENRLPGVPGKAVF
jgi:hypothetical protein